jgi:hypothetical protein
MTPFVSTSIEFTGTLTVALPGDEAFELFSPLGETRWVPDWNPEWLHPPGATWERGQIFRTREMYGDAVWIVTALDRAARDVEYHRVESGRYVARVRVRCEGIEARQTRVDVRYAFIGLSAEGNAEIARMKASEFDEKMQRWDRWIREHVTS